MSLLLRKPSRSSSLHRYLHGELKLRRSTAELRSLRRGRGGREAGSFGEEVQLHGGGSLPLSSMSGSTPPRSLDRPHCQVPFLLPHPSPLRLLQERLLVANPSRSLYRFCSSFPSFDPQGYVLRWSSNLRGFCSFTCGGDSDGDSDSGSRNSAADPKSVDVLCKVIDELFDQDGNVEDVIGDIEIELSHDLVLDVLHRFQSSRKQAFWFFYWAAERPGFRHDSRTYNAMMSILGGTRQFEAMVLMLEEMGEKGLLNLDTFVIAIRSFAAAKERKKAVGLFELMKKYRFEVGVDVVNCLLGSLGRVKLVKEAQNLFEKLQHWFEPNLETYTVLLSGWCRVKNLMEAVRVWNEMIDKGFNPDIVAHNVMLRGLLSSKKRSDAIKLFEIMKAKGPLPDFQSYTMLIKELCKHSKMEEAVRYFDEMVASGYNPDAVVYTSLVLGCGKQKKMDVVFRLLNHMKEKDCPPDRHTYNSLIRLMTVQRMAEDAARVYEKMVQDGVQPTIQTYNMMMKSYFQVQNFEMGEAIWNEIDRTGCCPEDNSYTIFIGGLVSQGRSLEACRYIEEMIEKGMKAPQLDYYRFAADFARAGKPDIIEELAMKMERSGNFEASKVFARWSEMVKKKGAKRWDPANKH